MRIAVIDDYQDAFRKLKCYAKLKGHQVDVYHDTEKDPARLAERLKDAEAVLLTQQRSPFPRALAERVPKLKLISQTGRNANHIGVVASWRASASPVSSISATAASLPGLASMRTHSAVVTMFELLLRERGMRCLNRAASASSAKR